MKGLEALHRPHLAGNRGGAASVEIELLDVGEKRDRCRKPLKSVKAEIEPLPRSVRSRRDLAFVLEQDQEGRDRALRSVRRHRVERFSGCLQDRKPSPRFPVAGVGGGERAGGPRWGWPAGG